MFLFANWLKVSGESNKLFTQSYPLLERRPLSAVEAGGDRGPANRLRRLCSTCVCTKSFMYEDNQKKKEIFFHAIAFIRNASLYP